MITRNTFSEILEELKDYYDSSHYANSDYYARYDLGCGNLMDSDEAILTLLSESLNDCDDVIRGWLHGLYGTDENGIVHFDLSPDGEDTHRFPVSSAGDLYDYLVLAYKPYPDEVDQINDYKNKWYRKCARAERRKSR